MPGRLAAAVVVLAAVWTLVQVLLAVCAGLVPADRQGLVTASVATSAYGVATLALTAVQVAAWVVTGIWIQHCQRFAGVCGLGRLADRGGPWAWFAWVLPGISFWFPFQIVRDLLHRVRGRARSRAQAELVGWWWCCVVLMAVAGNRSLLAMAGLPRHEQAVMLGHETALTLLTGLAAWLWIVIVRAVTRSQRELLAVLSARAAA
ncbi:DUF4328 domain-containing protein [Isoptericola luteus]|uniref:DUF4328 domain-containing protein n=1 Tax=Isoptericola luteus TaxID=2879484 RepID=UPI001CE1D4A6|nr:DUF4328 domain-containing protein [Isoptericola sp. NEAU-Y5]